VATEEDSAKQHNTAQRAARRHEPFLATQRRDNGREHARGRKARFSDNGLAAGTGANLQHSGIAEITAITAGGQSAKIRGIAKDNSIENKKGATQENIAIAQGSAAENGDNFVFIATTVGTIGSCTRPLGRKCGFGKNV